MSRIPQSSDRPSSPETNSTDQHSSNSQENTRSTQKQSSRIIMIATISSLVTIIAAVWLTSERNGPGSQLLTTTNAYATPIERATNTPAAAASSEVAQSDTTSNPIANCVATETMPGGDNFYVPNAPLVQNLGRGLVVQGTVREAESCAPVRNARIQIWLNTERGGEGEASNRGSVMTDENGRYSLETSPVVSQFGQPHIHIAYDDGDYRSLFLRAVMESEDVSTFTVDFILEPRR
ncbi:MAG: hypothetical protein HC840_02495 [Leptolyngbyaceae cyanobacterium RM2_2_4]|nr:hypothetical protein [Leptolyngbyaceae cyanobacterium RM2_2_4]